MYNFTLFEFKFKGWGNNCEREYYDEEAKGYCRVLNTAESIFVASFSLYLAVDVIKSIGDDIRIRLVIKSLLLAIRSILFFVYWNKAVNEYMDNSYNFPEDEFLYRTSAGGNLLAAIVCCLVILIVAIRYTNSDKKLHPFIPRLLGFLLLMAMGSSLLMYSVAYVGSIQKSFYFVVACILIVYDLQYV